MAPEPRPFRGRVLQAAALLAVLVLSQACAAPPLASSAPAAEPFHCDAAWQPQDPAGREDFCRPYQAAGQACPWLDEAALEDLCRRQEAQAHACSAQDGLWYVPGMSPPGTPRRCLLPTPDAGRACTSSSQCRRSTCVPDGPGTSARPGIASGHCDKYGIHSCGQTVEAGSVVTPPPCPVI